jgi:glutathionylspermidine synthase|tara:strand:+ start:7450 stop:7770 length:321 start_codon:yes stop_codon:yes gene_type:complete
MKKTWNKDKIHILLIEDRAIIRAISALWKYQTLDEKKQQASLTSNKRGFNHVDASIMSSFKEFYDKRGFLSKKQCNAARKILTKYENQLAKIANGEFTADDVINKL